MSEAIIKQMRSEEVLIESERFAYKVLNASLNGIYIPDVKLGQNVFINSQYTTITGYTFDDLMRLDGTQFFELFHPDDRQRVAEHMERVVNGRDDVVEVEYRFKTRHGRWIWCLSQDSEFAHNQDGSVSQIIGTFIDITERKEAEERLKKSERRYRNLFQNHHAVMLLIDPLTGDIINANPAACDYYGYALDEITGKKISDINMLPYDRVCSEMQSAKSEECRQFFFRHRMADGRIRDVEVFSGPIFIEDRELLYSIVHDITERKQAEEELRQSRKDLDRAQEVGQIGSWRLDVSDNILTWSDENHRIFGVSKGANLTYESFLEIVHPDDREFVDTQWKAGLRGEPYDIEHRIIVAGEVRWVREKAYLEFNEEGRLLG